MQRHDAVRDELSSWVSDQGVSTRTEQIMPKWSTSTEQARLDTVCMDPRRGEICVDISCTDSVVAGATKRAMRSSTRREQQKHKRYPGRGLVPFVLDTRGRWGREAHAFVNTIAATLPWEERADAIRDCKRRIAVALQTAVAEQIMSAARRRGSES